jgi:putative copper export protein
MKTTLFICAIISAIVALLAMTAIADHGQIRGVDGYKKVWKSFRSSRSGQIWSYAYKAFLFFYFILVLEKYKFIQF